MIDPENSTLQHVFGRFSSVRGNLTLVIMLTTAAALLTTGLALLRHDLTAYRQSLQTDLITEADILALSTAPAIAFEDQKRAQRNVSALSAKPEILIAALYFPDGTLYAKYVRPAGAEPPQILSMPGAEPVVSGGRMTVARKILQNGEFLGTIYLVAAYDVWGHVNAYLRILGLILLMSLGVALAFSSALRRSITGPVEALASVANEIVTRRDPTLRAPDTPLEEFSLVVKAFNSVLDESHERTQALQQANQALRQSEKLYRAIGESIDYGVWVTDATGRNVYASDSFLNLVGINQEQCSNLGWGDMLHPDDVHATMTAWAECVRTGDVWYREHRFRGVDGHYHSILAQGVQMRDEDGKSTGWAGINLDISRMKKTEEALREADRRKDEFLATLAHELRNPLAPIRHAARLLGVRDIDEARSKVAREIIARQVSRMALLLDDLLDLSRITRGRLELRKEPVALAAVISAALETAQPLIDSKHHELSVHMPQNNTELVVDPLRISQALSNLLTNAAKYTDPGGRIALDIDVSARNIRIAVSDSGIGIQTNLLPTIFEMFSQVDSAIDRSEGGLGIGLALVKGLVSLHGGKVEAASAGPGKGSTFTIELPVNRVHVTSIERPTAVPTPPTLGPFGRILVVDDNRDAANSLAMVLSSSGHESFTAYSGEQALQVGEAQRPDVVVLDIGMPDMTGYEAAQRIRHTQWGKALLLLAITGWGQKEDVQRAVNAGFNFHMTKPADPDRVEKLVRDFLANRESGAPQEPGNG
jgi:PAS domain S-box-containing protein